MPDSIRELLQGIAGGEPAPSGDLAAGAYKRARRIGRRRFTAAAIGAITGLALASVATTALVNANGVEEPPAADDPTATERPTETTPDEPEISATMQEGADEPEWDGDCSGPDDWAGWGASNSLVGLDSLPETLYFEVNQDGAQPDTAIVRFDEGDDAPATVFEDAYLHYLAPDGNRYALAGDGGCDGALSTMKDGSIDGLGIFAVYCKPVWSPDSDRVVLSMPDGETAGAYLVDIPSGEMLEVPPEVDCSPRWSADGTYLVSADGSVAMRPDGSGRVELAGAASWTDDEEFTGLSSISADLSRACLQFDGADTAQAGRTDAVRCDRYVDTATGDVLKLPIDTPHAQVVFLPEDRMIICDDRYDEIAVTLADADGNVQDVRTLPGQGSGGTFLRGYFTE